MIANLMTTLLMALGVATGNVSSNVYKGGNAFNHEKVIEHHDEKPKQNAIQNFTINENFEYVNGYAESEGWNYKYYIDGQRNYTSPIGQLTNSSYESTYGYAAAQQSKARNFTVIRIDPYRLTSNNDLRLELQYSFTVRSNPQHTAIKTLTWYYQSYLTYDNYDQYIDLTYYSLQDSNPNSIYSVLDNVDQSKLLASGYDSGTMQVQSGNTGYITATLTASTFQAETPIWFVVRCQIAMNPEQYYFDQELRLPPNSVYWYGEYLESNYEIIDVPGLLFTILTMPFSFYSTAFNLTIFPGTPYALNFGNLILTIIAALILFYLLKKIL